MGWGDQGRQHQTRVSLSRIDDNPRITACPMCVTNVVSAIFRGTSAYPPKLSVKAEFRRLVPEAD